VAKPTAVKRTVDASVTRIPGRKPERKEAARIAKKKKKKKILFVPLLRPMSPTYQPTSAQEAAHGDSGKRPRSASP
jgi:hypothetical protein